MTRVRSWACTALAGLLAVGLGGCGPRYAPVSGVVTLNGKPHRNALVIFLPVATADNQTPGLGSSGKTDADGRFKLKMVNGVFGAAAGKNRVRITTVFSAELKGYGVWDPGSNKAVKAYTDPIPAEWNSNSQKEFDVPSGGTDQANFDIVTGKAPRRP